MPLEPGIHGREQSPDVYGSGAWARARDEALDRDNGCLMCPRTASEVHHATPISAGGDWFDGGNLMSLCVRCHAKLHLALNELDETDHEVFEAGGDSAEEDVDPLDAALAEQDAEIASEKGALVGLDPTPDADVGRPRDPADVPTDAERQFAAWDRGESWRRKAPDAEVVPRE